MEVVGISTLTGYVSLGRWTMNGNTKKRKYDWDNYLNTNTNAGFYRAMLGALLMAAAVIALLVASIGGEGLVRFGAIVILVSFAIFGIAYVMWPDRLDNES